MGAKRKCLMIVTVLLLTGVFSFAGFALLNPKELFVLLDPFQQMSVKIDPETRPSHPVFDGVKKVYVYVQYSGYSSEKDREKLFAPFLRQNIEELLVRLYKERFSSECVEKPTYNRGYWCYDNRDQPVILLSDTEYRSPEIEKEIQRNGTLTVLFLINIISTSDGNHFQQPIAVFNLLYERPEEHITLKRKLSYPYLMPPPHLIGADEERVQEEFISHIRKLGSKPNKDIVILV